MEQKLKIESGYYWVKIAGFWTRCDVLHSWRDPILPALDSQYKKELTLDEAKDIIAAKHMELWEGHDPTWEYFEDTLLDLCKLDHLKEAYAEALKLLEDSHEK